MAPSVFVTGASGFIAKHLIVKLLNAGYRVVGSVRRLVRADEVVAAVAPHVKGPLDGRLRFVALDLARDAGWDTALEGTDALIHTASPFPMTQPKAEDAVVRPAVEGARRALTAAHSAGVTRVVMTSSSVAIVNTDLPAGRTRYTEEDWTAIDHPAVTPYAKSKTLAEMAAWEFVRDTAPEMALTIVNPVFVLGAPLDRNYGTSIKVIERLLKSQDPALPKVGFANVDVEDVAEAHLRALERPETAGKRYIVSDRFLWFHDMADVLKAEYPDRRIVTRQAPNFVVRLLSLFDPSIKTILPILGRRHDMSTERAQHDLGMRFKDARESVKASARFLVDTKSV